MLPSSELSRIVLSEFKSMGSRSVLHKTEFCMQVLIGAKAGFLQGKTSALAALEEISEMC